MKSIFLVTTINPFVVFGYGKALFLFLLMSVCFASPLTAGEVDQASLPDITKTSGDICPTKEEIISKTRTLQMPFIANNGQVDEQVRFYAKTFGGTVFVTKDGEIVYSLPSGRDVPAGASQESGRGLKHGVCRDALHASLYYVEQGGKVLSGWHGQAELVRAVSEFVVVNVYSPLLHADNANCPPDRVFTNALLATYLPGLQKKTAMLPNYHPHSEIQNLQSPIRGVAIKEQLVGGKTGEVKGGTPSVAKVSYFKGNDPSKWKSGVSTYEVVDMGEVYKGIGLRLRAYGNNVEKLFTVTPIANPEAIKLGLNGAKALKVNEEGQLVAETELGPVKFTKPFAYQEIDGKRVAVAVEYCIQGSGIEGTESRGTGVQGGWGEHETTYSFTVASYDRTKDLIIDPLMASTFLGGSDGEWGNSLSIDQGGNVYVTGFSISEDFPTTAGAYDISNGEDVFISKFNSDLTSLLASTCLGGGERDEGYSLVINKSGDVYVTGYTWSAGFPATTEPDAYDIEYNGSCDAFVARLSSDLTTLKGATFLGGTSADVGKCLSLHPESGVYVTGYTQSINFPTTAGAYKTVSNGGRDVFVSWFNDELVTLGVSTYLGGAGHDYGESLAIGKMINVYNVYVAGWTESSDFPTTPGAYSRELKGTRDVFLSSLNYDLSSLIASTYFGGKEDDKGYSLLFDKKNNVLVTGATWSSDFPVTPGAYDRSFNGGHCDVFVSRFKSDLTSLLSSTFLGGDKDDVAKYLTVDASGSVFVTGYTWSENFPTRKDSYDTSFNGGNEDAFVSKFSGDLTGLLASTFLAGTGNYNDNGKSLAIDTKGNVYVTGGTYASTFPTTSGAYDTTYNGNWEVFVSKFDNRLLGSADTDGDGLLDDWERNGYDADDDGIIDVDLPAMGANYKHKDIFVEIDWMANNNHNHKPSAAVLKAVQKAFKDAPVTNPDKIDGIKLHLDVGALGGGNVVAHDDDLNPVWDEFDAIKNVHFDKKRAHIFHYCLFAHNHDGGTSAGISRDIPASDFIISLGSWDNQVGTKKQQAADFMHELGHNLGLRHGGNDNVNYKPNFLSIMNYFFSMNWLRYNGKDQKLDYSRLDIDGINENGGVREDEGLEQVGGDTTIKKYGTRYFDRQGIARVVNESYRNVDWDGDGEIIRGGRVGDLNNDGAYTYLEGRCMEWEKIVYAGGSLQGSEGLMAVIKNPPPTCPEFTYEKYLWLKESTVETE